MADHSTDPLAGTRQAFAMALVAHLPSPVDPRLVEAFATTPRERFLGPGPWRRFTREGYVDTPSDDPALLYDDIVVGLKTEAQINNGQPSLHAACIAALRIREGETVLHIGAGTGYYTAILASLAGETGAVIAYEVEADLAARAAANLIDRPSVTVHHRSGSVPPLPSCDVIYVNAGATGPAPVWLDVLRPGGRLLFPLTGDRGVGAMLLVTRLGASRYTARFLAGVAFIPCAGARDEAIAHRLSDAFARGDAGAVRSLRRGGSPDDTSWFAADDWWLSSAPVEG